jgi:hypothetical protein
METHHATVGKHNKQVLPPVHLHPPVISRISSTESLPAHLPANMYPSSDWIT